MGKRQESKAAKPLVTAVTPEGTRQYVSKEHGERVVRSGFQRLYQDSLLVDVTLVAEGKSFKVHRCLLGCCSEYFCAMFSGGFKESSKSEVTLQYVTSTGLQAVIDFIYYGKFTLGAHNIDDVIEAASHLQMWNMLTLCEGYLHEELSRDTCLHFLQLADRYALSKTFTDAKKFMLTNFLPFTKNTKKPDFLAISADLLSQLVEDDDLCTESELQVFDIVKQWLKHDPKRKSFAESLLGKVRFGLMTAKEMEVFSSSLTSDTTLLPHSQNVLKKAMRYHMSLFEQPVIDPCLGNPRACLNSFAVFFGSQNMTVTYASPLEGETPVHFKEIARLNGSFSNASIVAINSFVFVVGGEIKIDNSRKCTQVVATAHRYDSRNSKWLQLSSMKTPRCDFAVVAVEDGLIAVGGQTDRYITKTVEKYSFSENEWSSLPNLKSGLYGHAGSMFKGQMHISGGNTGGYHHNPATHKFHCYDEEKKEWQKKPNMIQPRMCHAMVPYGDKLLVCCGFSYTGYSHVDRQRADVMGSEIYDSRMKQWSRLAPIPLGSSRAGCVCYGGSLYILGGHNTVRGRDLEIIQQYDTETKKWSILDITLPQPLSGGLACCLKVPRRFFTSADLESSDCPTN